MKPAPVAAPAAAAPQAAAAAPVAAPVDNLTIKCVDVIADIKLRAAAKKVFFKSKKAGEDDITKIDKIIAELKPLDGFSADIEQQLTALKPAPVAAPAAAAPQAPAAQPAEIPTQIGLFDIKILNDIDDIKARAALKKVYMGAKKASKNTNDVIPEMITELDSKDLLSDKIKSLLEGILK